jgi:hypothetical protein
VFSLAPGLSAFESAEAATLKQLVPNYSRHLHVLQPMQQNGMVWRIYSRGPNPVNTDSHFDIRCTDTRARGITMLSVYRTEVHLSYKPGFVTTSVANLEKESLLDPVTGRGGP